MKQVAGIVSHVELQLYRCRWPREARQALLSDRQITLTALADVDQGHVLQLCGEAPALADLMAYIHRLQALQQIDSVRLRRVENYGLWKARGVRFSVEATRRRDS